MIGIYELCTVKNVKSKCRNKKEAFTKRESGYAPFAAGPEWKKQKKKEKREQGINTDS